MSQSAAGLNIDRHYRWQMVRGTRQPERSAQTRAVQVQSLLLNLLKTRRPVLTAQLTTYLRAMLNNSRGGSCADSWLGSKVAGWKAFLSGGKNPEMTTSEGWKGSGGGGRRPQLKAPLQPRVKQQQKSCWQKIFTFVSCLRSSNVRRLRLAFTFITMNLV